MEILVVGASIAGLVASLSLKHHGFSVTVVDAAHEIDKGNAGLELTPNAMAVLLKLALGQALADAAGSPRALHLRDGYKGDVISELPLGGACQQRYGAPYLTIHRRDLLKVLIEQCEREGVELYWNTRLTEVEIMPQQVVAGIAMGEQKEGVAVDIIVAADGMDSSVMRMLGHEYEVFYSGMMQYRGTASADKIATATAPKALTYWTGREGVCTSYFTRGESLVHFAVTCRDPTVPDQHCWRNQVRAAELDTRLSEWFYKLAGIYSPISQLYKRGIFVRKTKHKWQAKRVTRVGDALRDRQMWYTSQNIALAIEDGWILAEQLSRGVDKQQRLARVLSSYEKQRADRTARVQRASTFMRPILMMQPELLRQAVKVGIRVGNAIDNHFLYGRHDPIFSFDATEKARLFL